MRILGITAEYNPFHRGHKYHIEKSMEETGADACVAVMSGDFTQRGEAAVADKWTRSRWAVENGVDLVLELPFVFACNTARDFARGAVDILAETGATHISFGSESGEIDELTELAEKLETKAEPIDDARRRLMEDGGSYAASYERAVGEILGERSASLMRTPNNILALEYLRRMIYWRERGRVMEPYTLKRAGSGYNDADRSSGFAGAAAIRAMLAGGDASAEADDAALYVPENVMRDLREAEPVGRWEERAFTLLRSELVRTDAERLSEIYRMGEGLENRFKREIVKAASMRELISSMVSKRYTEAAVRRLTVYILTGMYSYGGGGSIYGRVLAAGGRGRELLRRLKSGGSDMPVITNINREEDARERAGETLRYDITASDIYNIVKGRDLYAFSDRVMTPYISQKF